MRFRSHSHCNKRRPMSCRLPNLSKVATPSKKLSSYGGIHCDMQDHFHRAMSVICIGRSTPWSSSIIDNARSVGGQSARWRRTSRKCRLDPALADHPIVGRWVEPDHFTVFHNSTQIVEITNVVQRIAANEDQIRTIALADLADLVAQPDRLCCNACGTSQC